MRVPKDTRLPFWDCLYSSQCSIQYVRQHRPYRQLHFRNKTPAFFTIGSAKLSIQCFHYSISIQIIICDILYRLSLPLVFETFVMGSRHSHLLFFTSCFVYRSLQQLHRNDIVVAISPLTEKSIPVRVI